MPTDTNLNKMCQNNNLGVTMKRKKLNVRKSNSKFKQGMRTNVRNVQKQPSRGGIRL